jgi:hypothetical protein
MRILPATASKIDYAKCGTVGKVYLILIARKNVNTDYSSEKYHQEYEEGRERNKRISVPLASSSTKPYPLNKKKNFKKIH